MLNTLTTESARPDQKLTLKVDFPVIRPRNLDPYRSHDNSGRYIVKSIHSNLLVLKSLTGDNAGKIFALPRMPCRPGERNFPIEVFTRTQITVRIFFATTVKKAQGKFFCGAVRLYLSNAVFSYGQLHVELLRVTYPEKSWVCLPS